MDGQHKARKPVSFFLSLKFAWHREILLRFLFVFSLLMLIKLLEHYHQVFDLSTLPVTFDLYRVQRSYMDFVCMLLWPSTFWPSSTLTTSDLIFDLVTLNDPTGGHSVLKSSISYLQVLDKDSLSTAKEIIHL